VRVWDPATGKTIHILKGHTGEVWRVAFSPDGKRLASASQDGSVRVWNAETGHRLRSLEGNTGGVWGVAFSPDGRRVAFASGDPTHRHSGHSFLSPLAPGRGNQTVRIWDADTGEETLCLQGNTGSVFDVAFSPDGRRLAAACTDRTVRVWDTATGQKVHSLQHRSWVASVIFSPDGRRLASGSKDGTVKVWEARTGQELLTLQGHTHPVDGVAFSRDGRRLASASLDGTVKVWDATEFTPQRLIEHEARGLVQWLFEESPLPALPVSGAGTVGFLASPQGQGYLLAASTLLPNRPPLPQEVAAAVRRDPTITEAVRQQALDWVQFYGRRQGRAKRPAK
jgi:WD40 repeat protein